MPPDSDGRRVNGSQTCEGAAKIINANGLELLTRVRTLIISARRIAARQINTLQVMTNFEIGRLIFEYEQSGDARAHYGERLVRNLSKRLVAEFGRGFSKSNLEYMRRFFLEYRHSRGKIAQTLSGQLVPGHGDHPQISQTVSGKLASRAREGTGAIGPEGGQPGLNMAAAQFTLSWSHYVFLMAIEDRGERRFYELEAAQGGWSLRELRRQYDSGLYERLSLSRDAGRIRELSRRGQIVERPEDVLKEPYVLEFLGLDEKEGYREKDLESAIIGKLQRFLLELGKGFLFEARQKRLVLGPDVFFVDLVFYNKVLRCHVLVDLKIGKLAHQDLGQMLMYVNYFDRHVKSADDNPTIGIILCKMKNDALVELTLPADTKVYPRRYQLFLPSKEELRDRLNAWVEDEEAHK
jgi:predicted nuclease of restriction endonuclease-like (RecB) superfamily